MQLLQKDAYDDKILLALLFGAGILFVVESIESKAGYTVYLDQLWSMTV